MALPYFGLDIGNHSIKAIRLDSTDLNTRLAGYAYGSTPAGVLSVQDEESFKRLAKAIKDILNSSNLASVKQVIFAVPESHVIRQLMHLPYMNDEELENSVIFEMKKWINTPIEQMRIDKVVIGEKIVDGQRIIDVLGVAVRIDYLDRYVELLSSIGLEPIAAETEGIATVRAIYPQATDLTSTYLIVDVGSQSTDVSMAFKYNLLYSDSIPYGSDSVTKAISQTFSLDLIKAEAYKKTYGMVRGNFGGKLADVIEPVIDVILNDVRRLIDFFRTEYSEIPPQRIYLTGEASNMPGFLEYCKEKLQLDVVIADPWTNIVIDSSDAAFLKKNPSAYTVAIGLARKSDIF